MAKMKDKNSAKSLAMVIVTGLTLVAVTLCWFAISDKSAVDSVDSNVHNDASSFANIYYGADESGNIAIRPEDIVEYKQIKENLIVIENMIPGAEYTYMAKFPSAKKDQIISLNLDGISDQDGNLMSSVKLNRRVSLMSGEIEDTRNRYLAPEIYLSAEDSNPFEYTVQTTGEHRVFYSFKITEDTTSAKENMSIEITNVDAVISDV